MGMLLYDGDCGFCSKFATFVTRRFSDGANRCVPWQGVGDLEILGLSERILHDDAAWIDTEGRVALGHRAIGHALAACRGPVRSVGTVIMSPLMAGPASRAYRLMARNRGRISAGLGCKCSVVHSSDPDDRLGRRLGRETGMFRWVKVPSVFGLTPVRVRGDSMLPTLRDGDRLAVRRARTGEPRLGQLVVISESGKQMVKRVSKLLAAGIEVVGDNPSASRDSRHFGPVLTEDIEGVVAFRYWPPRPIRRREG